jgi:hypothetical protein
MFVLSKRQFSRLTCSLSARWLGSGDTGTAAALLDLGAGDGRPTLAMSEGFGRVLATEASAPMQRLLIDKGFQVVGIDEWAVPAEYDLIRKDSRRSTFPPFFTPGRKNFFLRRPLSFFIMGSYDLTRKDSPRSTLPLEGKIFLFEDHFIFL